MGPFRVYEAINLLNTELNPICHLLQLLRAHQILHFSRIRVKAWFMLERAVCDTERGTARHGVCIYAITGQLRAGTTGTKPFFVYTW